MTQYDFRNLSPYDFEVLVRDLLSAEFGAPFESFAVGPDTGIDLRLLRSADSSVICQCKHYTGTFSSLTSDLRRKEVPKVAKLQPDRYMLATSVPLTPSAKSKLKRLFAPHILSEADVRGRSDLDSSLALYPQVERRHFKLWLTSTAVLERVLHAAIYTRTERALEAIQDGIRKYVRNASFDDALTILDDTGVCVISEPPGIGKSTLAQMLLVYLLDAVAGGRRAIAAGFGWPALGRASPSLTAVRRTTRIARLAEDSARR